MDAFWGIVASNAIVATGLAIVALVLGRFWKNAAAVHALWAVVLLRLFTPPLYTAVLPFFSTLSPALSVGMLDKALHTPVTRETGHKPPDNLATTDTRVALAASDSRHTIWPRSVRTFALKSWSLSSILAVFWSCGSCGAALVYAVRIRRFADSIGQFKEAPLAIRMMVAQLSGRLGLSRVPEVLMTSRALPPLVWSLGTSPRVILPSGLFAQLSREAQTTIVAHELVHIRRGDHRVRLLELAATTAFWWHPAVWLARRELRELEEQCCDGRVLELLPDQPRTYAAALVDTLEYLAGRTRASVPLRTAIHSTHSLSRRITMLTQHRPNRLSAPSAALIIALVAGPLAVAFAVGPEQSVKPALEGQPSTKQVAVLQGRLTDGAGVPLADVRVRVAIPAADMRYINSTTQPKPLEARSDANGDYRLELPGIAGRTTISIDAMKPGYGRLVGTIMGGGDARRVEVEPGRAAQASLVLNPARYFRGVVVDEQGQPIPGVDVVATLKFGRGMAYVEATETDPDGSFELFNYAIGPIMIGDENEAAKGVVQFSNPNYVDQKFEDLDSLDRVQGGAMHIVLKTGYKVTGTVVDVAGKPVPNAMVKAALADAKVGKDETHRKATLTDANGKFALRGLSEGETILNVRALKIKQKTVTPVLKLDRDKNVEIQLQPIALPADLKKYVVLGMELADVTPELKSAYDLYHDRGALILDPGKDYERLNIGQIAEGYEFWIVGKKRIGGLRDFVDQILAEIGDRDADEFSVRVVYTFSTPEFEGTNTQSLKITKEDIRQLRAVSDRLAADAR